jgi:hypothetical protein
MGYRLTDVLAANLDGDFAEGDLELNPEFAASLKTDGVVDGEVVQDLAGSGSASPETT